MYNINDKVAIFEDLFDLPNGINVRNEVGTIIKVMWYGDEKRYNVQCSSCVVYNLSEQQIIGVSTMFTLNEYVFVNPALLSKDTDPGGRIIGIHANIELGETYYYVELANDTVYVREANLKSAEKTTPLTLKQTLALKDALAINLLELIQMYEVTTGTHIADIHLDTTVYVGDGVQFKKVIGVSLVVHL